MFFNRASSLVATPEQEDLATRMAQRLGVEGVNVADTLQPHVDAGNRMARQVAVMNQQPQGFTPRKRSLADNLGLLADAFRNTNANGQMLQAREDGERSAWFAEQRRQQDRAWQVEDRDLQLNKPEYFMSGRDRVQFDPRTGQSSVIYDGLEDHETYARQFGEPGSPEYQAAAQDYILRGNGPTAYGFDADLEGVRQGNRVDLETLRQRNRIGLRQTPTFAQSNPRPASGGSGRPSRAPTMAGIVAPILAKVSRGEKLTPAEQQAWSMYRPGRGGGGGGKPKASGPTATDPKTGRKVQWNGSAWVPAG
jgi:hypothetical protein